ncbi:hypothetical protein JMA_39510 (plasmid) [Jeotgalibacillus malaysiensis]|uniref:Uncharacterized protein n=1 Tax=Jeotgalibacillus malaysiensis TaxID=1508404 RepID=A0A0B5AZ93_9BACL|nr:hypothetical protein [Jeotgalibacillus malaysiensis]AJD93269.1 hypothetical protein JMA_39510 [Jeotgalibacillus malaysiensis]
MENKYEFTGETVTVRTSEGNLCKLNQIRALKDIPRHGVKEGDIGGWVEHHFTLSQEGDCWIGANSHVFDGSGVSDDALVSESKIMDLSHVKGKAKVVDSIIMDGSTIEDEAVIRKVNASGRIHVGKNVEISDTTIKGFLSAEESNVVIKSSALSGENRLSENTEIIRSTFHNVNLDDGVQSFKDAILEAKSEAYIYGDVTFYDAYVSADTITFSTEEKIRFNHCCALNLESLDVYGDVLFIGAFIQDGAKLYIRDGATVKGDFDSSKEEKKRYSIHILSNLLEVSETLIAGEILFSGMWSITGSTITGMVSLQSRGARMSIVQDSTISDCVSITIPGSLNGARLKNLELSGDGSYHSEQDLHLLDIQDLYV